MYQKQVKFLTSAIQQDKKKTELPKHVRKKPILFSSDDTEKMEIEREKIKVIKQNIKRHGEKEKEFTSYYCEPIKTNIPTTLTSHTIPKLFPKSYRTIAAYPILSKNTSKQRKNQKNNEPNEPQELTTLQCDGSNDTIQSCSCNKCKSKKYLKTLPSSPSGNQLPSDESNELEEPTLLECDGSNTTVQSCSCYKCQSKKCLKKGAQIPLEEEPPFKEIGTMTENETQDSGSQFSDRDLDVAVKETKSTKRDKVFCECPSHILKKKNCAQKCKGGCNYKNVSPQIRDVQNGNHLNDDNRNVKLNDSSKSYQQVCFISDIENEHNEELHTCSGTRHVKDDRASIMKCLNQMKCGLCKENYEKSCLGDSSRLHRRCLSPNRKNSSCRKCSNSLYEHPGTSRYHENCTDTSKYYSNLESRELNYETITIPKGRYFTNSNYRESHKSPRRVLTSEKNVDSYKEKFNYQHTCSDDDSLN